MTLNMSFKSIEHSKFIRLMNMFRFFTNILKRTFFEDQIRKKYQIIQCRFLQNLKSNIKINIALNNWTSSNNIVFMNITNYFINKNWKYREVLLIFQSLSDAHTSETMIKIVVNILKKYKLKNRLLAIIIDNASNNEKMRKKMKKILKKIDIEWDHEKNHVFCIAHVIQLAVNKFLESMKISAVNDKMNEIFQKNRLNDIDKEIDLINILLKIWYFSWTFLTN
jgi:hypothetical protein